MKPIDFETKLPFTEHLVELRTRLVYVVFTVIVFSIVSFLSVDYLIKFLERPLPEAFKTMSFISPTEGFFVAMKISVFTGIFFSSPVILYHSWLFVAPGLKNKEKKSMVPLVFFGTLFFLMGTSFAYFAILPLGLNFLISFGAQYWSPTITVANYLSFALKLILGFGVVFELPLVIAFLCKIGLVTTTQLIKFRKYAFLASFVLASILTPPDVITQVFMAFPLALLYEVGIYAGKLLEKKRSAEKSEDESED